MYGFIYCQKFDETDKQEKAFIFPDKERNSTKKTEGCVQSLQEAEKLKIYGTLQFDNLVSTEISHIWKESIIHNVGSLKMKLRNRNVISEYFNEYLTFNVIEKHNDQHVLQRMHSWLYLHENDTPSNTVTGTWF